MKREGLKSVFIGMWAVVSLSCNNTVYVKDPLTPLANDHRAASVSPGKIQLVKISQTNNQQLGVLEQSIIAAGLVDISKIDSSIIIDMKYSTSDNFLQTDVYGDFNKCYLQPDVAEKLKNAQHFLKTEYPYYNLIVFDGVRPRSVQSEMWKKIDVPVSERSRYVSNPQNGSIHNYGAAVDLSIMDENNIQLDMGTPYDYFGELAYPREEERFIQEGKLTYIQLLNRELLRKVMQKAGFFSITTEWWHFNSCSRNLASVRYKIVE